MVSQLIRLMQTLAHAKEWYTVRLDHIDRPGLSDGFHGTHVSA